MNYEFTVLAALVQLNNPTRPKITEATGISTQKINSSIKNLKIILGIGINWHGAKKTGHYQIESWGAFESGKRIRYKAGALKLSTFKRHKRIEYDSTILKQLYAADVKLQNYRHSLKLEGFETKDPSRNLTLLSPSERKELREELKRKFTRPKLAIADHP